MEYEYMMIFRGRLLKKLNVKLTKPVQISILYSDIAFLLQTFLLQTLAVTDSDSCNRCLC